ncbi:MAG: hypothetical protein J7M21_03660, partial [Planctomycetes bacterium]|nr:hypothetical protein [Planctomycetota bacterium]
MSPAEIAHRCISAGTSAVDRCLFPLRRRPMPLRRLLAAGGDDRPGLAVTDMQPGEWADAPADSLERRWYERLIRRADAVARGRLDLFDIEDCDLGTPIDWNADHKSGRRSPMRYARGIDYRRFDVTGDCKFVWEPSRHHQFVTLGRAYRAGGDARYARAFVEQLVSWLDQCPYGIGMNWRSPMELGIRLINWVWALELVRPAGLVRGELRRRVLNSIWLHMWEITRQYSAGSSAGNHLIGEAAGVFVAACYLPRLRRAARWRQQARDILIEQIIRQTFPDGGCREQTIGYHYFITQFFLLAGLVERWCGRDFPGEYWQRLEKLIEYPALLLAGGDQVPMYGDADDGMAIDLGERHGHFRSLLAT